MAKLEADKIIYKEGLKINQKILPDGMRWEKDDAGFRKGDLYKAEKKMTPEFITIHNPGNSDAETFARATWNQNMKSDRIHFYVDDKEVWQLLREDEVGWHAGDGDGPGNSKSLAVEICMGDYINDVKKSEENGALLTAILMRDHKISISKVVPHKYWKRSNGTYKNCPIQILPHWDVFLDKVREKYKQITSTGDGDNKGEDGEYLFPVLYRVEKGDTLSKIAKKFDKSISELVSLNPHISDPNIIYAGDMMIISLVKSSTKPKSKYIMYKIKAGDSLSRIAKQYKTTIQELLDLNPYIKDKNVIYIDDYLVVPNN